MSSPALDVFAQVDMPFVSSLALHVEMASLARKRALVDIRFMPTLVWHVFGPHLLSCILCIHRHLVGFFIEV